MKILVTGGTGNVGQSVLKYLVQYKLCQLYNLHHREPSLQQILKKQQSVKDEYRVISELRIATTDVKKAKTKIQPFIQHLINNTAEFSDSLSTSSEKVQIEENCLDDIVTYTEFDFSRSESYESSVNGVDGLFLVRPPQMGNPEQTINPFLNTCKDLKQVVFLSLQGIEQTVMPVPHKKIESHIESLKIPFTFVRPSFFNQNLSTTHLSDIQVHHDIMVPAGSGKTAFIDVDDIGLVSALSLIDLEQHKNKKHEITGNEALSYFEVAEIMSKVLNKKISYNNPYILSFIKRQRSRGVPFVFTMVMIALYSKCRFGYAAELTNELEKLLLRKPISFKQFVESNKDTFLKGMKQ